MSRFAPKKITKPEETLITESYPEGFSYSTSGYSHIAAPGLTEQLIREISEIKHEPAWMLQKRLQAYAIFQKLQFPEWGADLSGLNFADFSYYLKPSKQQEHSWADVPADIKTTFDRLKVPEAEKAMLAGVKAQYDSEVVYGSLKKVWGKQGVVFLSMDEGLAEYPDLVKEYFGTLIPAGDNVFAALNTAVWSGGSFVYVPPGVHVTLPLQTYFRINAEKAGQFERTLIIVDEGAKVHYVEGCFLAGTTVDTSKGLVDIEKILVGDLVVSHQGQYRKVYRVQARQYTGTTYSIKIVGQPSQITECTEEHPFLIVRRKKSNERNKDWEGHWMPVKDILKGDYVCIPINNTTQEKSVVPMTVCKGSGRHPTKLVTVNVPSSPDFFRLAGYYLAEGSIDSEHYLHFSFSEQERGYIDDVKNLVHELFHEKHISEVHHRKNHGTSVVVSSTILCRVFKSLFGVGSSHKHIPSWMLEENSAKQRELIIGWFRGDGNYFSAQHKHGYKENFRISTTSRELAQQGRNILARLGIASSLNSFDRSNTLRLEMFTLVIGGEYMVKFGDIVQQKIDAKRNSKKSATPYFIDEKYLYAPVRNITQKAVENIQVYNLSVQKDESYTANGLAVHNCTAPQFSSASLHSAVVEIFLKPGAQCQYTTIQNWYRNVYNLVTKRSRVDTEAQMIWTDFNMGSRVTMKYPSCILAGKGARGETLSMALAGAGQHQDTGAKMIHLAPHTSSSIVSKSVSKNGGRTSYRGLVYVGPQAHHSKNSVVCDALLLDDHSRSDTYPTDRVFHSNVEVQHEATVSKIGDEQLLYLMTRGLSENTARKMIVNGFIEDLVRLLPLEYAVEMNRLIDMEMEGGVG